MRFFTLRHPLLLPRAFLSWLAASSPGAADPMAEEALGRLAPDVVIGAALHEADFRQKVDAKWVTENGTAERSDGGLRITHTKAVHASHGLDLSFGDVLVSFTFQMGDAGRIGFIVDNERGKHSGYFSILPGRINAPHKEKRGDAAGYAEAVVKLAPQETHRAWIVLHGDEMRGCIDDGPVITGTRAGLSAMKSRLKLEVYDGSATFADFRVLSVVTKQSVSAVKPSDAGLKLFHAQVEPLLKTHCYECHSHEAKKAKGGLVLDSRAALLKGGDLGAAVVPGDPAKSLLLEAMEYHNSDLQMPPDAKLPDAMIASVREWIRLGAPDPRAELVIAGEAQKTSAGPRREALWSVQPLQKTTTPMPRGKDWARNDIDRFLLAALEAQGLSPSPDAEAHVLLRRLHDVLTGLPPSLDEQERFTKTWQQQPEAAIAQTTQALLGTRAYGERWARHWLDVARYADTSGATAPKAFTEAWRYREYVISAFQNDMPWAQFVREQIAGDLLPHRDADEKAAHHVATGYLALSHVLAIDRDPEKLKLDTIDEQLDVIGKTFLGVQIGCARCHDHKIDPFPTRDYYALAGIFRSTVTLRSPKEAQEEVEPAGAPLGPTSETAPVWLRGGKKVRLHSASDERTIRDEAVHLRGELAVLGEVVPRGFPTLVAMSQREDLPNHQSGRVQLADWILSEENVLARRVIVNRVWHHVFGHGLVRTTDNFGLTGDAPSHPELLDWLVQRFTTQHRGSFKSFISELVMTHAFRQSSASRAEAMTSDPGNRLLWRMNPRRRDAESLIDGLRAAAGTLDTEPAAFTAPKFGSNNQLSTASLAIPDATLNKRVLYWPVFRKDVPIALDLPALFDFPPATAPRGTRGRTQVPAQSLALLNSPLLLNAARALNQRLDPIGDEAARIRELHRLVLARPASAAEVERTRSFLDAFTAELIETKAAKPQNARAVAWNRLCHAVMVCNESIVIP